MKEQWDSMGMPIVMEISESTGTADDFKAVKDYFQWVDDVFSIFKPESEITKINRGEIKK